MGIIARFFYRFLEFLSDDLSSNPNILLWIVLLPLLGAVINGVGAIGTRSYGWKVPQWMVSAIAIGSVGLAFILGLSGFIHVVRTHEALDFTAYEWFSFGWTDAATQQAREATIAVRFLMDQLSAIMVVMVTFIATLIHVYSASYMGHDPGYARFMTYLNLFTASMLILVLGSNIPVMFVGWEGVGLCSYLLIGFWWDNPEYAAAGRKAFVVNRIGDFGVLIGTFLLVSVVGSFEFRDINAGAGDIAYQSLSVGFMTFGTVGTAAALFLFLGCTGKSAQLPLYVWLPDAMAGPTPVSALIHAATMVTSGIYLCCRLSPVFAASEGAMAVIAIIGASTALIAATIGVVQNQLKKVLAYSTVSQLGFMFAAVGSGAFAAGLFHVFTHAFFKACLFLGAGSVMHAVHAHGDADIRHLGGLRKFMPRTHMTFLIACLAIAGFPLTAGFFSKDEILFGALESSQGEGSLAWVGYLVFGMLALAALMTAFYMFRLYFRTFWGEYKGHADGHSGEHTQPHESDAWITSPLIVLSFFALVAGFLGLPHWLLESMGVDPHWSWWSGFLTENGPVHGAHHAPVGEEGHHTSGWVGPTAMAVGTLVGLLGIGLAYTTYVTGEGKGTERLREAWPKTHRFLMNKWKVDELYRMMVVRPLAWLSVLAANVDRLVVDTFMTSLLPWLSRVTGAMFTRLQNGAVSMYSAVFAVGIGGLLWWFTFPHPSVDHTVTGAEVALTAATQGGQSVRYDFDSDGTYDTEWQTEPTATHNYAGGSDRIAALVLTATYQSPMPNVEPEVREINVSADAQNVALPGAELSVRLDGTRVVVRTSADLGQPPTAEGAHALELGQALSGPGGLTIRVNARYRVTAEFKNVFGNQRRTQFEVVCETPHVDLQHVGSLPRPRVSLAMRDSAMSAISVNSPSGVVQ